MGIFEFIDLTVTVFWLLVGLMLFLFPKIMLDKERRDDEDLIKGNRNLGKGLLIAWLYKNGLELFLLVIYFANKLKEF